ncbi:MAG: T9SS type A sorting domain-containing protein, partial [Sphingobacteriales bacterium]
VHDTVLGSPGGTVYVDDTSDENRIFSERLSYDKGSAVVHSLRFIFDNDSLFFGLLKGYQQTFGDSTATTEAFKQYAAQVLNKNLDTFFQQWIYKEGYPVYSARWNQVDSTVYVELTQLTSLPSSQTLFSTPIELKLLGAGTDTTIRVTNNQNVQTYTFNWNNAMQGLSIDPNNWILNTVTGITKDITLGTDGPATALWKLFPNPSDNRWNLVGVDGDASLTLTAIDGKTVWTGRGASFVSIPCDHLTAGMYILKISSKTGNSSLKLIRK